MPFGLLSLLIGQIFGNTVVPIGTKIVEVFTGPLLFVLLRFSTATVVLFLLFLLSRKKRLKLREYEDFMILGILLSVNVILFTVGISYTTVIMSTLIYSITPILVGILGHYFLGERLDKQKAIGFLFAITGFFILICNSLTGMQRNTFGHPLGNILIFIAMLGYSTYVFYSRKVLHTKDNTPIQTTFLTFSFTSVILLCAFLVSVVLKQQTLAIIPGNGIVGVIIVGVGSVAQYLFLQIGVKKTSAFTASLFQYLSPFIAASATIPLLHEKVTLSFIVGGFFILLGVFTATTFVQIQRKIKLSTVKH